MRFASAIPEEVKRLTSFSLLLHGHKDFSNWFLVNPQTGNNYAMIGWKSYKKITLLGTYFMASILLNNVG